MSLIENSFALFAMHGDLDESRIQYIRYLEELPIQNIIIISTNETHLKINEQDLFSSKVVFKYKENSGGLDFALWQSQLQFLNSPHCLILANDSCLCNKSLLPMWMSMKSNKFWGVTDSYEISHHLQSYFLVFDNPQLVKEVCDFLKSKVFVEQFQVIREGEVGLSSYLLRHGYKISAAYEFKYLQNLAKSKSTNPAFHFWKTLQSLNCPLIKKKHS